VARPYQHLHHPLKQRYFADSSFGRFIFNQPFMVKDLRPGGYQYRGQMFSMHGWHQLLDGRIVHGYSMNGAERLWHGTTDFQKAAAISGIGAASRLIHELGDD